MSHKIRRLLLLVLTIGVSQTLIAHAAEEPPPPSDVPTLEQIEQVTKTKPSDPTDEVYVGETLTVDAQRHRELAYRTIQVALDRPRSDRADAADDLVCRKLQRTGSHITKAYCATNRTWNYIRKVSTRDFLGAMSPNGPGYELHEGPVYEINPSAINALSKQFQGKDHQTRLAQLAAEELVGRTSDEWNTPAETIARFARALDAVTQIARSAEPATQEAAMTKAIEGHGFTVEQYNDLASRLESSGLFQRRVAAATQAFTH